MRVYAGDAIRNVAIVGHGGCGKTSLVDALAFVAGSSKRHGSVPDGSALTDYTPDEIERQYSINLALAHAEWMDTKINLIDTPGYLDFIGDAAAGLYAADAALIAVNATAGVEVGTEQVWDIAAERGMPRMFVVTGMDRENADFEKVFQDIKAHLTSKVVPIEVPVGEGADFHGIVNLFSRKCHTYTKGTKSGEYKEGEIPPDVQGTFDKYAEGLMESVAEVDDDLIERYLEGGEITRDEALAAMSQGFAQGELFPLLCVAAPLTYGTRALLSKLVQLVPPPTELAPRNAQTWGDAAEVEVQPQDNAPFVAQVFKTVSEPHVGDVSQFRIWSGTIDNGHEAFNAVRETPEKLAHLSVAQGKERMEVPKLHAGDIGLVAKLKNTHTNDTLSSTDHQIVLPKIPFPEPIITMAIEVTTRGEEDKLGTGDRKSVV